MQHWDIETLQHSENTCNILLKKREEFGRIEELVVKGLAPPLKLACPQGPLRHRHWGKASTGCRVTTASSHGWASEQWSSPWGACVRCRVGDHKGEEVLADGAGCPCPRHSKAASARLRSSPSGQHKEGSGKRAGELAMGTSSNNVSKFSFH